jgi:hypothetical protein
MLGKFIAGDFIAIAGELRRFPASNENIDHACFMSKYASVCMFIVLAIIVETD